jgi:putative GTP pyrophosphokinase
MTLESEYSERLPVLKKVAGEIESLTKDILREVPRIDRVSTRVKSVEKFLEKTIRKEYKNPLHDIQDQIGERIVVFFRNDVQAVASRIAAEFREVEDRMVEQPDPESFSYEARHIVCLIPPDIQVRHNSPIDFFELQVSTLFQHAWAEANHDLGYKSQKELRYDVRRRIAWAASQAWGADTIFDELWLQLSSKP